MIWVHSIFYLPRGPYRRSYAKALAMLMLRIVLRNDKKGFMWEFLKKGGP